MEELILVSEKAVKDIKLKIDLVDFDEEIRHINTCVLALDTSGKTPMRQ